MGKLPLNPGPSVKKMERTPVKQDIRNNVSGPVETFGRRNTSATGTRRISSHKVPSSKDVQADSDKGRVSRTGSTSRRVLMSSSRPSSSVRPSENHVIRPGSDSGRISTTQRPHPGSFAHATGHKAGRDDTL